MTHPEFELKFTLDAKKELDALLGNRSKAIVAKAVVKTLKLMASNLKHPSLNTHKYDGFTAPNNKEVFESYAQNRTPGAYRIFWFYGLEKGQITIIKISEHP